MRNRARAMLGVALLVVACGGGSDVAGSDRGTTATEAAAADTTSTMHTDATLDGSAEVYDLLYIQDSIGFGVAQQYAGLLKYSGRHVAVTDKAIGNLRAVAVLESLRGIGANGWPELVREAEIIVLFGNPEGSGATSDLGTCISASTLEREPPQRYSETDWQPYRDVLDEIYAEIWELRDNEPVVLLAVDFINPAISAWRQAGIESECTAALEAMNRAIREAAEDNGATLVSLYDVFNGPNHDQDPREKGWIGEDGIHPSGEGELAIAMALMDVGLHPTTAP